MIIKLFVLTFAVFLQYEITKGQRMWVSPTTTAQEMRNPSTWFTPYYMAGAEAYSKFFQNARDITSQLYQQGYMTGAFGNSNGYGIPNRPSGGTGGNVPNVPNAAGNGGVVPNWG